MPSIAQQDNLRLEAKSGDGRGDYGLQLQLLNAIERKTIFDVIYRIKAESLDGGTTFMEMRPQVGGVENSDGQKVYAVIFPAVLSQQPLVFRITNTAEQLSGLSAIQQAADYYDGLSFAQAELDGVNYLIEDNAAGSICVDGKMLAITLGEDNGEDYAPIVTIQQSEVAPPSGTITNISWEDAQKLIGVSVYIGE